jgi:hypothetical protein
MLYEKNVLMSIFGLSHMSKNHGLFRLGEGLGKVCFRLGLGLGEVHFKSGLGLGNVHFGLRLGLG